MTREQIIQEITDQLKLFDTEDKPDTEFQEGYHEAYLDLYWIITDKKWVNENERA